MGYLQNCSKTQVLGVLAVPAVTLVILDAPMPEADAPMPEADAATVGAVEPSEIAVGAAGCLQAVPVYAATGYNCRVHHGLTVKELATTA